MKQRGFIEIVILVVVLVAAVGAGAYYLGRSTSQPTSVSPDPVTVPETSDGSSGTNETVNWKTYTNNIFQKALSQFCMNEQDSISFSGEIDLDKLPLKNISGATKGRCDAKDSRYVLVNPVNNYSFITISDSSSQHCCHGPSDITPTGKLIRKSDNTSVYIHTGTWTEGPNSDYKPIYVRGVRELNLPNGEKIRIVADKEAIKKDDPDLRRVEDKYFVNDQLFDSGKQVLTPESVEELLNDSYLAILEGSQQVESLIKDLENIIIADPSSVKP
ncbi:hypothetical protein CMO96_03305 [Candidatus Woesebacteria bacterium]|nr:hypothetical protein [Candidatus Woesebacteria bacterium]|tara:strand:- start:54 stop:872 length:819 start_codon:yes stop_codon:yes gene_type:complete